MPPRSDDIYDDGDEDGDHLEESLLLLLVLVDQLSDQGGPVLIRARVPVQDDQGWWFWRKYCNYDPYGQDEENIDDKIP